MGGDEWVHERLKVWAPPLRQRVANLPVLVDSLSSELRPDWCEPFIQSRLEPLDLVVFGFEVVARELKERVCNLQHQDVRVIVFVTDKDAFTGSAHSMELIVFFEAL